MVNAAHQERTIELNRARREHGLILKEAGLDLVDG
jgi:hypothetical protein